MALCNQSTINKDKYRETMSEVYDHWVSKKGIEDRNYEFKIGLDNENNLGFFIISSDG